MYLIWIIDFIGDLRSPERSQFNRGRDRSLVTRQMSDKEMVTMTVIADTKTLDNNSVACATNL